MDAGQLLFVAVVTMSTTHVNALFVGGPYHGRVRSVRVGAKSLTLPAVGRNVLYCRQQVGTAGNYFLTTYFTGSAVRAQLMLADALGRALERIANLEAPHEATRV
jgi:hypothetical protein